MNYRKATNTDIDRICDMIKSAIKEMEKNNIFQWDEIYPTKEDFLSDIERDQLFVGCEGGDICAVYAVNTDCDEQYKNGSWNYPNSDFRVIHRLCVNPKYQNRGIAKHTLNYIEENLANDGVESVRLDVFAENPFALSLYQKNGYKTVGIADWRKGRFFLMEKQLSDKMIAYCGLDCKKCDAYLATKNNDQALREKTAKLWSELNGVEITSEQINCEGCRADGKKTVYCESLCAIRKCASKKALETCGDCEEMRTCASLGAIIANNPAARANLEQK